MGRLHPPGSAPTSVFLVLFFILARSHAAENRLSACWKACWKDASNTTSSEKRKRLSLQFPTPSSTRLWLSTAVVLTWGRAPRGVNKFPRGRKPLCALQHGVSSLNLRINTFVFCFYSLFKVRGIETKETNREVWGTTHTFDEVQHQWWTVVI